MTYQNQSKDREYRLQGSMYRWLNPKIITKDVFNINYIFTDFNAGLELDTHEFKHIDFSTDDIFF